MNRVLKVFVGLMAVVLVATPAFAVKMKDILDNVNVYGEARVRGFWAEADDGVESRSHAWNDQRLRLGSDIFTDDGNASFHFRFDAAESDENSSNDVAWGGSTDSYAPYSQRRGDIQFDKAFLRLKRWDTTFDVGQMVFFGGFGTGRLLSVAGTGFVITHGDLKVAHVKQYDANNGNNSFTKTGYDETSLSAVRYELKGENYSLIPMASYTLKQSTDVNRLGLGLYAKANLGSVKFKGELDYFSGENAAGADEKGLQFFLDASLPVSETVVVGGIFLYAQGQDGGDVQVTSQNMPVFIDFHPEKYGAWPADFVGEFLAYDPSGDGAGVIFAEAYSDYKASSDLKLKFAGGYLMSEDDSISDVDGYILNASGIYALTAKAALSIHCNYTALDDNGTDKTYTQVISGLTVKF